MSTTTSIAHPIGSVTELLCRGLFDDSFDITSSCFDPAYVAACVMVPQTDTNPTGDNYKSSWSFGHLPHRRPPNLFTSAPSSTGRSLHQGLPQASGTVHRIHGSHCAGPRSVSPSQVQSATCGDPSFLRTRLANLARSGHLRTLPSHCITYEIIGESTPIIGAGHDRDVPSTAQRSLRVRIPSKTWCTARDPDSHVIYGKLHGWSPTTHSPSIYSLP